MLCEYTNYLTIIFKDDEADAERVIIFVILKLGYPMSICKQDHSSKFCQGCRQIRLS